jgi:hypothetical protein
MKTTFLLSARTEISILTFLDEGRGERRGHPGFLVRQTALTVPLDSLDDISREVST